MSGLTATHPPQAISFLITELEPGGAERNLVEIATRLDHRRFSPSVYSIAPPPEREMLAQRLQEAGVPTIFLGCTRRSQFRSAVRQLTDHLVSRPPALLQTFLFHANVVGAAVARRIGSMPLIAGIRVVEPHGRLRRIIERRMTREACRHVCVSRDVAEFCRHTAGLPSEKLIVIPNGVDLSRFDRAAAALPSTFGFADDRRLLTCIGRLDRQKRVDRAVRVFQGVHQQLPDHDLLIVGDGPQRLAITQQINACGLAARARVVGWRADVPSILKASDLLLLVSDWEGMPNVVLEAMAAAKPIVALDTEGVAELVGDENVEQIVRRSVSDSEADRIQHLSERIVNFVRQPAEVVRIGQANYRRAQSQFCVQHMVDRYQQLYTTVLESHGGATDSRS